MRESKKDIKPVQLRGGFSDRHGIKPLNTQMQINDFDERTRTVILNALHDILKIINEDSPGHSMKYGRWSIFYLDIATQVYNQERDKLEELSESNIVDIVKRDIRNTILFDSYDSVLTIIEFILNYTSKNFGNRQPRFNGASIYYFDERKYINDIFEKEYVGYRFIGEYFVAITDNAELKEIEETLYSKIHVVKKHIEKALGFLSNRENPDYKKSIKESISAVEAICKIITGDANGDLSKTLKKLKDTGIHIHPTLEQAWVKLYAYTCDEGGVRHAEKAFESNVTFEEAKYMLVSCCAFVNYLIAEYGKIK